MEKIAINLLPVEFTQQQIKNAKFYKVQFMGVATIMLMAFLASLTIALRILQSQNIKQVQAQVSAAEQRVSDLKSTQASLLILKNRVTTITQYLGTSSKQASAYKLLSGLLPSSVAISSLTVDRNGEIFVVTSIPDVQALDSLISDLVSKERNQDKVNQVSIETLNRGRDGIYRLAIKIKTK